MTLSNPANPKNPLDLTANTADQSAKESVIEPLPAYLPMSLPTLLHPLQLDTLDPKTQQTIAGVDACLPQTQCGLCEHPDGCLPYAHAIVVHGEPINKCVPGGQPVTDAIAQVLNQPRSTATPSKHPIDPTTNRPQEVRAVIIENECIGCTKCIPACPIDAIVGTGKHMHTIFTDLCTGCELCLPPCPVDCIKLVPIERTLSEQHRQQEQHDLRQRYHTHLHRVEAQLQDNANAKPVVSMVQSKLNNAVNTQIDIDADKAKTTIEAAKLRSKIKKLQKQLSVRDDAAKRQELSALEQQLSSLNDRQTNG